jgi:hypothetical protein
MKQAMKLAAEAVVCAILTILLLGVMAWMDEGSPTNPKDTPFPFAELFSK